MSSSADVNHRIIQYPAKHLRVLGLPGSGKTNLLIERYKALDEDAFVVTFSRDQLKHITNALLEEGMGHAGLPQVFTYFTLAREIITASGRRAPRVAQELEERLLVQKAIRDNTKKLKSDYRRIHESESFQRELVDTFHLFLQYGINGNLLDRVDPAVKSNVVADVVTLYRAYRSMLGEHGYTTYYDVARHAADACVDLPKTHPLKSARVILVDDFQDIDPGQYKLLTALVPPDGDAALNVFGDPMGAYFGYRGTHARYLMGLFPEIYGCETMRITGRSLNDRVLGGSLDAIAREVLGADADGFRGSEPVANPGLGPLFDAAGGDPPAGSAALHVTRDEVEEIYGAAAYVHDLITKGDRLPNEIALVTNSKQRYEPLLRAAFAQRGIAVDTGRPHKDVFRSFVHTLLLLLTGANDVPLLQALVSSPFYPFFRSSFGEIHAAHASDPDVEARHISRALAGARLPREPHELVVHVSNAWLRPACEAYQKQNDDEAPFAFLSLLGQRWEEFVAAAAITGHKPGVVDFLGASELFATKAVAPMPSVDEVGLYNCREAKGRFFRDVVVLGCSELLFPSAMRRESIMPAAALQKVFGMTAPDAKVSVYGARTPAEHLREEYHLLYHSLTRATETLRIFAPRQFSGQDHPAPAAILDRHMDESARVDISVKTITPPQVRFARSWVRQPEMPGIAERIAELSPFGKVWNLGRPIPPKFAIERFPLSKSSLERYLKCPRLFYYEKALRVPQEDTNALLLGNLFHEVMARLGKRFPSKRRLHAAVTGTMISELVDAVINDEKTKTFAADSFFGASLRFYLDAMVRGSLKLDKKESGDYTIEQVESSFDMTYRDWEFRGKFDRIENTAGLGVVLDYKTGEFKKMGSTLRKQTLEAHEKPDRANWQVPIYVWAYKDANGRMPDAIKHMAQKAGEHPFFVTLYVRRTEDDLPAAALSRKRDDQAVSYLLEDEVEAIMNLAVVHAETIFGERTAFAKTDNHSHCRNCMFSHLCDRRAD